MQVSQLLNTQLSDAEVMGVFDKYDEDGGGSISLELVGPTLLLFILHLSQQFSLSCTPHSSLCPCTATSLVHN